MTTFAVKGHRIQVEPTATGLTIMIMPVVGNEIVGSYPLDLRPSEANRLSSEIDAALRRAGHV